MDRILEKRGAGGSPASPVLIALAKWTCRKPSVHFLPVLIPSIPSILVHFLPLVPAESRWRRFNLSIR
jgi:hypothetical protein